MLSKRKTGILLISNGIGGAEKRFNNYFQYLNKKYTGRVCLLINQTLYDLFVINNLIKSTDNVIILNEPQFLRKYRIYSKYKFRIISKLLTIVQRINFVFRLIKTFKSTDIELLHGVLHGVRYLPLISRINSSITLACSVVDTELSFMKKNQLIRGIGVCDAVDCLNPAIYNTVENIEGLLRTKVFVTPNSFTDYSKCLSSKFRKKHVVFCARLEPCKNPNLFLDTAEIVNAKLPEIKIKYTILGSGVLLKEIKKKARRLNLKGIDVKCLGYVSDPSVFLRDALVFVQPTKGESHATQSLLEAMGCGCAVITTALPGIERVVPYGAGFTCKLNAEEFAEKVILLLTNYEDAVKMGQMARRHVKKHFSVDSFAEYLDKVYDNCAVKNRKVVSTNKEKILSFIKTVLL